MRLYFEDYKYDDNLISSYFDGIELNSNAGETSVSHVGYIWSGKAQDAVFILPKIFIVNNLAFGIEGCPPEAVIDFNSDDNPLNNSDMRSTISELSIWIYRAISHFFERNTESTILNDAKIMPPVSSGGNQLTMLEATLRLLDFQRKHKNLVTFITRLNRSGNNCINWNKTISRSRAYIVDGAPYYIDFLSKKKSINFDEALLVIYHSVLRYLKWKYCFNYSTEVNLKLMPEARIQFLIDTNLGTRLLQSIRYKYFTDSLVDLWNRLNDFFSLSSKVRQSGGFSEHMLAGRFNIVFEDMVDQLISDHDVPAALKNQKDGKEPDHIYLDKSLIEPEKNIWYIGDSKYYKTENEVSGESVYKQFTYAKNVIQCSIDNASKPAWQAYGTRYRDDATEGYNVTPNFFLKGQYIPGEFDYMPDNPLTDASEHSPNTQFPNRLFDRDTILLHEFNINFLFVLEAYATERDCPAELHKKIRASLIKHLNSKYRFYRIQPVNSDTFVRENFKLLNGKLYRTESDCFIMALEQDKDINSDEYALMLKSLSMPAEEFKIA